MLLLTVNSITGEAVPVNLTLVTVFLDGGKAERDETPKDAPEIEIPAGGLDDDGEIPAGGVSVREPAEAQTRVMIERPTTLVRFACGSEVRCWGSPAEVAGALLTALQPKTTMVIPSAGPRRIQ